MPKEQLPLPGMADNTDVREQAYQEAIDFLIREASRHRESGRPLFANEFEKHAGTLLEYYRVTDNTLRAHQASLKTMNP